MAYHYNSVKLSEFSFAIYSAKLQPTLVLVLCVCALFSLPSSTSSHSVWSATPVSGRLTRAGDPRTNSLIFLSAITISYHLNGP